MLRSNSYQTFLRIFTITVSGCLLAPTLSAQSKPAPVIGAIHSSGQKRFSEGQVIAASGARTGQVFDVNAIEAATQKLGQSGAFEEVQFKYRPENGKMAVEFVVREAAKFHRCTFDNFVWASTKEIEDFIRKEVPLFDGYAPESGDLPDDISGSLERFLQQRHIVGHVERVQFGRSIGDPNWEHLFTVNGPVVKVQGVAFEGVKGIDVGLLQKEAKPLVGRNYSFVDCRTYAAAAFVPVYRERGFLKVEVGSPESQLSKQTQGPNEFSIQVTYPVKEGLAYDWEAAKWDGNQAKTSAELGALLGMKHGGRANGKKLDEGWEAIQQAYGKKGYVEVRLKPEGVYDDANRRVEFHVAVSEGPQYAMGTLSISGVPLGTGERLKNKWRLRKGDVYDASYVKEFMKTELYPELPVPGGRVPKVQFNIKPDRSNHIVDVSIQVQ
jgi:outer membrane protein assembly factor BamA